MGLVARHAAALEAVVEVEEEVYRFAPANNGAGPMWCSGSTAVVRVGDTVFATGLETVADWKPLNNCRWVLWRRTDDGWKRVYEDAGRTREPSPLAVVASGTVVVSANPTLNPPDREGGGPARPELRVFATGSEAPGEPGRWTPEWQGRPRFSEHSYRSLASDPAFGGCLVMQNVDYTHAEWALRNGEGQWWSGQLKWPWGAEYARPQPIRICYPNVALRDRAAHFVGVSDIAEPNPEWRAYKRELTGREWDYDFRRLFYTWTPDLTREGFRDWVEIASREKTCGWISPGDLWLAPDGVAHLLWTERALDERLRARFFPEARQSHALNYARVRDGQVAFRRTLVESTEDHPGATVSAARFHPMPDGRLLVVAHVSEGGHSDNRLFEVRADGALGPAVRLSLARPFTSFFTATPRAGSGSSEVLDLLGMRAGVPDAVAYARVRIARR